MIQLHQRPLCTIWSKHAFGQGYDPHHLFQNASTCQPDYLILNRHKTLKGVIDGIQFMSYQQGEINHLN